MSFADKVSIGTYNLMSLIVKMTLTLQSSLMLYSVPPTDKIQYFVHLSFNFTTQLITGILNDLQKLLKHFNGKEIVAFLRNPSAALAGWTDVSPNNLALYLKNFKSSTFSISGLKLVASSLE